MAPSLLAPPEVEFEIEEEVLAELETKRPAPPAPKRRNLLEEIFQGHEDFLGLTPD